MNELLGVPNEVRSLYACLVASICLLSGCIVKEESPAIKLEKAFIVGPEKTYPMELAIDVDPTLSKESNVTPYVTVVGKTRSFRTRFSALPDRSGFSVGSSSGKMDIEVNEEGVVYQMNGGEEVTLDVDN